MTIANISLTHTAINGGLPVSVECSGITISGKKLNIKKPNANNNGMVEVQTQGYENLKYVINGVHFTDVTGVLDWDDVLTLYKEEYNGSNAAILNITYGKSGEKVINGLSGSSDIDVILETPNLPISAADSRDGYLPIGSLIFIETD